MTQARGAFTEVSFFSLAGFGTLEPSTPERATLPNGMKLYYSLGLYEPEGNAGALADLTGWLDGELPLGVGCRAQQKIPNAEWCLSLLGKLRPETEGCDANED